jgi:hypothetical protein
MAEILVPHQYRERERERERDREREDGGRQQRKESCPSRAEMLVGSLPGLETPRP